MKQADEEVLSLLPDEKKQHREWTCDEERVQWAVVQAGLASISAYQDNRAKKIKRDISWVEDYARSCDGAGADHDSDEEGEEDRRNRAGATLKSAPGPMKLLKRKTVSYALGEVTGTKIGVKRPRPVVEVSTELRCVPS